MRSPLQKVMTLAIKKLQVLTYVRGNNPCKDGDQYHNATESHKCENKSKKLKIESRNVSFYAIMQFSLVRVVCFLY